MALAVTLRFNRSQTCSLGLRSGLFAGHGRTLTFLSCRKSRTEWAVWLVALSCWRVMSGWACRKGTTWGRRLPAMATSSVRWCCDSPPLTMTNPPLQIDPAPEYRPRCNSHSFDNKRESHHHSWWNKTTTRQWRALFASPVWSSDGGFMPIGDIVAIDVWWGPALQQAYKTSVQPFSAYCGQSEHWWRDCGKQCWNPLQWRSVKLIGFLRIIFERQGPEKGLYSYSIPLLRFVCIK